MERLIPTVRSYAWGSRSALAQLRGDDRPSDHPEAELWLGAHPGDPAVLADGRSLLEAIDADPAGQLGPAVVDRFGGQLPFLLKILAAEEPLSLQAHPSKTQAEEGFAREERAGIAVDAQNRNYRDRNHKPEIVVALTDFEALAGFRCPVQTVAVLEALAVPALEPHAVLLRGQPDEEGLRALFTTWITMPQSAVDALLPAVLDGCVRYLAARGGDDPLAPVLRSILEIGEAYPGDVGVLSALLLNRIDLRPGEGLYLPAGNLHAYLRGTAVELMASSDNVLRGGLTPKHVDVPELLRVLDFHGMDVDPMTDLGDDGAPLPGEHVYPLHAADFRLSRIRVTDEPLALAGRAGDGPRGPEVLLCVSGRAVVECDGRTEVLGPTEAAWVAAADGPVRVRAETAEALVFRATVPQDR